MTLRIVLMLALMSVVSACGTKSALVTPQCSKEERAENAETAANTEDATNAPTTPAVTPGASCRKLAKGRKDPSQPPNPVGR
jgi:hypothetical protein